MRLIRRTSKPLLIVFSGIDGAGKSTQITALCERLQTEGHLPTVFWSRVGYTPLFETFKRLLRRVRFRGIPRSGPSEDRDRAFSRKWLRRLWLQLALADLAVQYAIRVRALLLIGRSVICDRYILDSVVDIRLNFPGEDVENWLAFRALQWVTPKPNVVFLMTIPGDVSISRSREKREAFPDSPERLFQRLEAYSELMVEEDQVVLDGTMTKAETATEVWQEVVGVWSDVGSTTGYQVDA